MKISKLPVGCALWVGCVLPLALSACGNDAPPEPPSRHIEQAPSANIAEEAHAAEAHAAEAESQSINASATPQRVNSSEAVSTLDGTQAHRFEVTTKLSLEARREFKESVQQRLSHSMAGLQRHPVGESGQAVDVHDRFKHVVVQVRGEDGKMHTECIEHGRRLDHILSIKGAQ